MVMCQINYQFISALSFWICSFTSSCLVRSSHWMISKCTRSFSTCGRSSSLSLRLPRLLLVGGWLLATTTGATTADRMPLSAILSAVYENKIHCPASVKYCNKNICYIVGFISRVVSPTVASWSGGRSGLLMDFSAYCLVSRTNRRRIVIDRVVRKKSIGLKIQRKWDGACFSIGEIPLRLARILPVM
jgi:hypothetical protein